MTDPATVTWTDDTGQQYERVPVADLCIGDEVRETPETGWVSIQVIEWDHGCCHVERLNMGTLAWGLDGKIDRLAQPGTGSA